MQCTAGEPTAEHPVDRRGNLDEPLLAEQTKRVTRIDFRQGLAEMAQRGLWRGLAHGILMFMFCSMNPDPHREVKRAGKILISLVKLEY